MMGYVLTPRPPLQKRKKHAFLERGSRFHRHTRWVNDSPSPVLRGFRNTGEGAGG
jgi:hypothetical protein